jgi:hypothetical protein
MTSEELAKADREARARWKAEFFKAYASIGTPKQAETVKQFSKHARAYGKINRAAKAAGVDYDPRRKEVFDE